MISADEALRLVLDLAPPPQPERVAITDALGRALLEPAPARLTQPPFDASAMDGYSLRMADLPGPLRVIGTSAAGHPFAGVVAQGQAVRIFTGAEVPPGCDRVVMQENVRREGDIITIFDAGNDIHIRKKGSDFVEGWPFSAGRRLTPGDLGLLAAMNTSHVTVARRPRVAILPGGDELVPPGSPVGPGQIVCSNDVAVGALARQAGAEVQLLPIARDTKESLRNALETAADCDLIVTIGGASVGDHDLIARVTEGMGMQRAFYKVAMRPGKPLVAGRLGRSALLGLPGNPVSSIICGMIFMQPLIFRMQGLDSKFKTMLARLGCDLPAEGPRRHFMRARLAEGTELPQITPFADQDSARLRLLAEADALLIREAGDPPRRAGDVMPYLPLNPVGR